MSDPIAQASPAGRHCPAPLQPNNSIGWLGTAPTQDEQDVVEYMRRRGVPRRICHVGVGNGLLWTVFGNRVAQALTKDGMEAENAREIGMDVILCNKYDVNSYSALLRSPFDCIVDVNIRSYACCDIHFMAYMQLMFESLSENGTILTSQAGLDYLKPTSMAELRRMFPSRSIVRDGNVVVIKPRLLRRLMSVWRRAK
jgi:hypothetical protein